MANDPIDLLQIKIEKAKRELPEDTQSAIAAVDWKAAILGMRGKHGYTFEQLGDLELETELLLSGLLNTESYPRELERRMKISKGEANELVNEMNNLVFKKIREELIKNIERKKIFANTRAVIQPEKTSEPANIISVPKISTLINQTPAPTAVKTVSANNMTEEKNNTRVLNKAGIEIVEKPARLPDWSATGGKETLPIPEKLELETVEKSKEEIRPILTQKLSSSFQIPTTKTEYSLNNLSKTNEPNPVSVEKETPHMDPYREIPQ